MRNMLSGTKGLPYDSKVILFDDNYMTMSNADLTNEGRRSVNVDYGLKTSNVGLRWVNYVSDKAAGIEFDVPASLVGKKLCWDGEAQIARYDLWGNVGLAFCQTRNYNNMPDRGGGLIGAGLSSASGYQNGQYSGVSGGGFTNIAGNPNGNVYRGTYGTLHYGCPLSTGTGRTYGYYDFSTWVYENNWVYSGTTYSFTRTMAGCTDAEKATMNTFLSGADKQIQVRISRGYGSSSYDSNHWRKLKVWYE